MKTRGVRGTEVSFFRIEEREPSVPRRSLRGTENTPPAGFNKGVRDWRMVFQDNVPSICFNKDLIRTPERPGKRNPGAFVIKF